MIDRKLMPTNTGTRALGTLPTMSGLPLTSWPTCERPSSYERSLGARVQAPTHLQFAGVVPAAVPAIGNAVAGSAVIGADAARKRGRPPRGIPR